MRAGLQWGLRAYTQRQVIALRPLARAMFFPEALDRRRAQRAALLDAITQAVMPRYCGNADRAVFQRLGNAVYGGPLEQLTRQFAMETRKIARPVPCLAVPPPPPPPPTACKRRGAPRAAAPQRAVKGF